MTGRPQRKGRRRASRVRMSAGVLVWLMAFAICPAGVPAESVVESTAPDAAGGRTPTPDAKLPGESDGAPISDPDRTPGLQPSAPGGDPSRELRVSPPRGKNGPGLDSLLQLPKGYNGRAPATSVAGASETEWRRRFKETRAARDRARETLETTKRELDGAAGSSGGSQWNVRRLRASAPVPGAQIRPRRSRSNSDRS